MGTLDEANAAITALDGYTIKGSSIHVEVVYSLSHSLFSILFIVVKSCFNCINYFLNILTQYFGKIVQLSTARTQGRKKKIEGR